MAIKIYTHTYKGQDVEIMYAKGKISYTFEVKGRRFGNAVKVGSGKYDDIINACFALIVNFIETYEKATA